MVADCKFLCLANVVFLLLVSILLWYGIKSSEPEHILHVRTLALVYAVWCMV